MNPQRSRLTDFFIFWPDYQRGMYFHLEGGDAASSPRGLYRLVLDYFTPIYKVL